MTAPSPAFNTALWLMAAWIAREFTHLDNRLDQIMALVSVDQTDLDNLAASLETIKTNLAAELAALQANAAIPAGSLDGLNAAVADLHTLEPPAAAPPA